MSKLLKDLGLRIYNNKMIMEKNTEGVLVNKDEMEIKEIVNNQVVEHLLKTSPHNTPLKLSTN